MSASTRTVQRTLGTSQLGGMLVLLAVLAAIVAALAFGSIGAKPAEIAPAAGFAAPVVRDLGARDPATIKGTNPEPVPGYWRPDETGKWVFVPFDTPDQALPSSAAHPSGKAPAHQGQNGPRLEAR